MKILWIVNMMLPALAKYLNVKTSASGTWMEDLSDKISKSQDIELAVACVYGDEYKEIDVDQIKYYLIPGNGKNMLFYTKSYEKIWKKINDEFKPDIVHLHGTEYSHGLSYLRAIPEQSYLLTIQGIISKIALKTDGELKFRTKLFNRTLRENLRFNGIIENKKLMKFNSRYEKEIINRVNYVTGRTDWDKAFLLATNTKLKYFRVFYNLRDEFYNCDKWNIEKAEPYTIYASVSASQPLKGGHIVMEALNVVKRKYPQVKTIFIAPTDTNGKLKKSNGYTKYINKLIKKYQLDENVEFHNRLNTKEVIEIMQKSRCCVVPSAMENASATLREAMDIGVPCIAAFRGGMVDLVQNGYNGFFFDYSEPEYLAEKIIQLFEDNELCNKLSKNSIKTAAVWHDRVKNIDDMIDVYMYIMEEKNAKINDVNA